MEDDEEYCERQIERIRKAINSNEDDFFSRSLKAIRTINRASQYNFFDQYNKKNTLILDLLEGLYFDLFGCGDDATDFIGDLMEFKAHDKNFDRNALLWIQCFDAEDVTDLEVYKIEQEYDLDDYIIF